MNPLPLQDLRGSVSRETERDVREPVRRGSDGATMCEFAVSGNGVRNARGQGGRGASGREGYHAVNAGPKKSGTTGNMIYSQNDAQGKTDKFTTNTTESGQLGLAGDGGSMAIRWMGVEIFCSVDLMRHSATTGRQTTPAGRGNS